MKKQNYSQQDIETLKNQLRSELQLEYNRHFHNITFLLFLAYFWETVEHYMELSTHPLLERLFQSQEFWANRIITDGICMVIGYAIAFHFQKIRFYGSRFLAIYLVSVFSAYYFSHEIDSLYVDKFVLLWGDNSRSLFDVWSFVHIATGTVFGSFVIWWNKRVPEALESK